MLAIISAFALGTLDDDLLMQLKIINNEESCAC